MKSLLIFFFVSIGCTAKAQVGVGIDIPNASAQLEISSTNKGLLPPRVALTGLSDVSTIASPATGLIVYSTSSNTDLQPGYHFYNGSQWTRLQPAIRTITSGENISLTTSQSGQVMTTQWAQKPAFPETLPVGFTCTIINYSNSAWTSNTLSTIKFYSRLSGWTNGTGRTTFGIVSGGTATITVIAIDGTNRYFVSGDIQ